MSPTPRATFALLLFVCSLGATAARPAAAASPQAGFNLFTVEQDIALGRESAAEAEKQLRLLDDTSVDEYLGRIVQRLAAKAPGARYPYQIQAVDDSTLNAFALPGGPMYVNRGLISAARSEAELAGVLAHEIAHVALRHGTHQASKAHLANAGLGILGGLLGNGDDGTAQIVSAIGGLGLNAAFLKFSRDAEYQADQVGAETMARAGYDPAAMADFFALLREEGGRNPSSLAAFFSDHPAPADREARIRQLARTLPRQPVPPVGGLDRVRAALRRLPPAPSQTVARIEPPPSTRARSAKPVAVRVPAPSARFATFSHPKGYFSLGHPDNWRPHASKNDYAASILPAGGAVDTGNGQQALVYGVVVNHYMPFGGETGSRARRYAPPEGDSGSRGRLEDATDDLVEQILRSNSHLRLVAGSARRQTIEGAPAVSLALAGRSPFTNEGERVSVHTRSLPDGHVIYALLVVPERDYEAASRAFSRMLRTLEVHDRPAHR